MKHLIFFIIVLVMLMFSSCKQDKRLCNELSLHVDVRSLISTYVKEHPQFNTFLIQPIQGLEQIGKVATKQAFLLGPGYKSLIEESNPISYFDILDKRVFCISSIDDLIQSEKREWIIDNEPDSVILSNGWVIRNSSELFILRSICFYSNELGHLEVNLRPDTIFAPRYLEGSIKFENILE